MSHNMFQLITAQLNRFVRLLVNQPILNENQKQTKIMQQKEKKKK